MTLPCLSEIQDKTMSCTVQCDIVQGSLKFLETRISIKKKQEFRNFGLILKKFFCYKIEFKDSRHTYELKNMYMYSKKNPVAFLIVQIINYVHIIIIINYLIH